jgi:oligosaccharyltransferase complex subunit beta
MVRRFISGNGDFIEDFTKWVFQENGVLKVLSTQHHRALEVEPRDMYRIKDDLVSLLGYVFE